MKMRTLLIVAALQGGMAHAERPMNVDDAGTLERGGAKLEFGWSKDDKARGLEAAAGFAPADKLELELGLARVRDRAASPADVIHGHGLAVKWVPLQADSGLSAGLKYEYGRDRLDGVSTRVHALSGLLTWRFEDGPSVHLNLGRESSRERGERENLGTWGVGVDVPLGARLALVVETFGVEHSGPDRALGLRYEIVDGLKVSAAGGRGSGRSFANAGIAWEF